MRTVIAIQARLSSKRLPNKVLADIQGRPMIAQILRRCRAVHGADAVAISCPPDDADTLYRATGVEPITGPEEDILTRMLRVAEELEADWVVRCTADCPLIPPDLIEDGIRTARSMAGTHCVQNWKPRTYPDGFDFDIWTTHALRTFSEGCTGSDREWFAQAAMDNGLMSNSIQLAKGNYAHYRLTVDEPDDLDVVRSVYEDQKGAVWGSKTIMEWCTKHPKIMRLNAHLVKNFGARPK